jgi:hypothetical protein
MKRVIIPNGFCIYDREKLLTYVVDYGIFRDKEWFIYKDFESNQYVVCQEDSEGIINQ